MTLFALDETRIVPLASLLPASVAVRELVNVTVLLLYDAALLDWP